MVKYKVFFYYKREKHFFVHNFRDAKEAKSWERAYNKHTPSAEHVYVDTTKEYTRKKRTHSARQRGNPYSMNLFGGNFRL